MAKAKAGLRGMNALEKQGQASVIYKQMAGNPLFPAPSPSMAQFAEAIERLERANMDALDRGRRALMLRNLAEQEISEMITRLAGYVNSVCMGDMQKITSAGFKLAKRPEPISTIAKPQNARVRPSPLPNQLDLRWSPVPGAVMYMVEEATSGTYEEPVWTMVKLTSDHRVVLLGRDKSESCAFRICAIGRRIQGPFATFGYQMAA